MAVLWLHNAVHLGVSSGSISVTVPSDHIHHFVYFQQSCSAAGRAFQWRGTCGTLCATKELLVHVCLERRFWRNADYCPWPCPHFARSRRLVEPRDIWARWDSVVKRSRPMLSRLFSRNNINMLIRHITQCYVLIVVARDESNRVSETPVLSHLSHMSLSYSQFSLVMY